MQREDEERGLYIIPEEAETVRKIFERFIELKSPLAIASELSEQGLTTKQWVMHMRNAQDQLRHKSADMTARVYTRSHLAGRHNEFANLPDIFEKCPTKVSHDPAENGGKTRTSAVRQTRTGNRHKSFEGGTFEQSRKPKNFRELSEQKRRGGDSIEPFQH